MPEVTTTYTLTMTSSAAAQVTQTAIVTVVPAPSTAAVISPDFVQASGAPQTTQGALFSNGPVVGEPIPALIATSPSKSLQVRHDFQPPVPTQAN